MNYDLESTILYDTDTNELRQELGSLEFCCNFPIAWKFVTWFVVLYLLL